MFSDDGSENDLTYDVITVSSPVSEANGENHLKAIDSPRYLREEATGCKSRFSTHVKTENTDDRSIEFD